MKLVPQRCSREDRGWRQENPKNNSRGTHNPDGGIEIEMFPYHALSCRSTEQGNFYRPGGFGRPPARSVTRCVVRAQNSVDLRHYIQELDLREQLSQRLVQDVFDGLGH
jgi:hypothetical protein